MSGRRTRAPTASLQVDHVKAKAIFFDNSVDALIAGFPECFPRFFHGTAISHRDQELHDQPLKEPRTRRPHPLERIAAAYFLSGVLATRDELDKFGELAQEAVIDLLTG